MDLDTFGIWILFWTFRYQNWVFGTVFGIWSFLVSRYDIGSIGAIFGVQVMKFRHVFKGAVKLKGDIGLERPTVRNRLNDRLAINLVG